MDAIHRALHISRSVTFDCTVTIDQLVNVPLLNGSFKVKWKFANPINSVQVEAQLKARHVAASIAQRLVLSDEDTHQRPSPTRRRSSDHSVKRPGRHDKSPTSDHNLPMPAIPAPFHSRNPSSASSIISTNQPPASKSTSAPLPQRRPGPSLGLSGIRRPLSPTGSFQIASNHHQSVRSRSSSEINPTPMFFPSSNHDTSSFSPNSPPSAFLGGSATSRLIEPPIRPEPSGSTPYAKVKNHTVLFQQAFHCPVSVQLDKDGILQPCMLNMIIKEERLPGPGRHDISKHGVVNINLSHFAPLASLDVDSDHLGRPRADPQESRIEKAKFLLRESRTNASLKVQIQMDYINGATAFKTPGTSGEVKGDGSTKASGQPDDVRSVYGLRKSSTGSPVSSIISSNSSYMVPNPPIKSAATSSKSPVYHSSSPSPSFQPPLFSPKEAKRQVADDVIDLLFSNSYVPPSGPLPLRPKSARMRSRNPSIRKDQINRQSPSLVKDSELGRSLSTRSIEYPDEKESRRSIKSFRAKLSLFNRSASNLSTVD